MDNSIHNVIRTGVPRVEIEHSGKAPPDPTKEELILAAAMDVFIERGWDGARMREIAERAGINKALLHYYFRSKQNLYDRIIESVFNFFFTGIDRALCDGRTFAEVLRRFVEAIIDTIAANPRIPLFMMHELSRGGSNVLAILERTVDRYGSTLPQRMFHLITREAAAGSIRKVDAAQLMVTLLGACIYYFAAEPIVETIVTHVQPGVTYDRERFIAQRKEAIFDVIYNGLQVRSETSRR